MPGSREASFSETSLNHLAQRARAGSSSQSAVASRLIRTGAPLISAGVDCLVFEGFRLVQQSTGDWGPAGSVDID